MTTIQFPGLIDVHVHLRDPGQTSKEDFTTGTKAALAGGFTTVLDMPNNANPITTPERLREKMEIASLKTVCDIGFYYGSLGDNIDSLSEIKDKAFGIKLYLNHTTGDYLINSSILDSVFKAWDGHQPILTHAEEETVEEVVKAVRTYKKPTHVCHVSSEKELTYILKAKDEGLPITCGVCPHHLFLTDQDVERLGAYGRMKPALKTQKDVDFLWAHINDVDVIESDHAPHTQDEKNSDKPPFGVPGLETTLILLLKAMEEGKLSQSRIIELCHATPARIFHIPTDEDTRVEVEMREFTIQNELLYSKCGWTPFNGIKVPGKVSNVYLRGVQVVRDGEVIAEPGSGLVREPLKIS